MGHSFNGSPFQFIVGAPVHISAALPDGFHFSAFVAFRDDLLNVRFALGGQCGTDRDTPSATTMGAAQGGGCHPQFGRRRHPRGAAGGRFFWSGGRECGDRASAGASPASRGRRAAVQGGGA